VQDHAGKQPRVYLRDLQTGQTSLVSVSSTGVQGNYPSTVATMTPDARYVVFVSAASNLVPGDTNNQLDIFVRDLQTRQTTRVNVSASGAQANNAATAALLRDEAAPAWLEQLGLPARLVDDSGNATTLAGWPSEQGHARRDAERRSVRASWCAA